MSTNDEIVDRLRALVKELERVDRSEDYRVRIQLRNILEAPEADSDLIVPASDFHEAVVAVKAIDETSTSAVAAVLALHAPVRRYQAASNTDTLTYPTAERALLQNRHHPLRGFEALVMATPDDVPFIEVCAECSRVENISADTVNGCGDDHDDEQDGTELSMRASSWPCATFLAITGAAGYPSPETRALNTIRTVVDRWYNGALINKGDNEGIVWVEPLWPLPGGADEIRQALEQGA